jgi:hypothetical protein
VADLVHGEADGLHGAAPKRLRSDPNPRVGDIVVFQKKGGEQVLGTPICSISYIVYAIFAFLYLFCSFKEQPTNCFVFSSVDLKK